MTECLASASCGDMMKGQIFRSLPLFKENQLDVRFFTKEQKVAEKMQADFFPSAEVGNGASTLR